MGSSGGLNRGGQGGASGISDTINELKDRFSPDKAIEYGTNYVRGPGGQRLIAAARENPMAAAVALAGIGWLLYTANRSNSAGRSGGAGLGGSAGLGGGTGSGQTAQSSSVGQSEYQGGSRPGVMGDWTEEQNLNQPGDPSARISRSEVEDAFGSSSNSDSVGR
jgi:hypothetical protein